MLKVMTLNMWHSNVDFKELKIVLSLEKPHVCLLQEGFGLAWGLVDNIRSLAKALGYNYVDQIMHSEWPWGSWTWNLGIMTSGRILDQVEYEVRDYKGKDWVRTVLMALIEIEGVKMRVVSLHYGHDQHMSQVQRTLKGFDIYFEQTPIDIVAGDFNMDPAYAPAFDLFKEAGFVDAWEVAGQGPGVTYVENNIRIDGIWSRGWVPVGAKLAKGLSDHYGVIAWGPLTPLGMNTEK